MENNLVHTKVHSAIAAHIIPLCSVCIVSPNKGRRASGRIVITQSVHNRRKRGKNSGKIREEITKYNRNRSSRKVFNYMIKLHICNKTKRLPVFWLSRRMWM